MDELDYGNVQTLMLNESESTAPGTRLGLPGCVASCGFAQKGVAP